MPEAAVQNVIMEVCPNTEGAADDRLVELGCPGDIAITRDVPLAARLLEKGLCVIDDRGRRYTSDNIREYLSLRAMNIQLEESGLAGERNPNYGPKEKKRFADSFDKLLTQTLAQVRR
jgi:uncharacterized protein YaiI (UPF0178 family)